MLLKFVLWLKIHNWFSNRKREGVYIPASLSVTALPQLCRYYLSWGPFLDLCVSSLHRGHANLLCIVPILSDVPKIVVTQKKSCNLWNPTLPKHMGMCRGIFLHYCVLWGRTKLWGAWAPKQTIHTQLGRGRYKWYQSHALAESVGPTREDACALKGGRL